MNASKSFTAPGQLDLSINEAMSEEGIVDVSGTFTGLTAAVEVSADGVTYRATAMTPIAGGVDVATIAAAGAWRVNFAGCEAARVNVTAIASGTALVNAAITRKAA